MTSLSKELRIAIKDVYLDGSVSYLIELASKAADALDAAQANDARYRWLREYARYINPNGVGLEVIAIPGNPLSSIDLDAAIDAARAPIDAAAKP